MVKKIFFLITIVVALVSCNTSFSEKDKEAYTLKGKEIAEAAFLELSTQLTEQMKAGGPAQAIPFCNQKAMRITNQLSEKFEATIKRTSNDLRNDQNAPSKRELEILDEFHKTKLEGKPLKPIVEVDATNKKHFYAPIIMKANCLVCHGTINETVNIKTDSIIKSLYPNDKAIGYNEGDLRGIWSITFKN
ncbi:DUF3365 domain-containing protein [Lutibacter sp.]|uniref:Tll0287-like domain-containing protein n=1 Tax=Lutibacter sp. TaxID=1925666 RepID=UPI001A208A02|nr:DUF3365 domain-containing protein [Lutibacter sp.]MBI9040004.1 DUF3365 domain-containing protein [Lutibacter sp.]